MNKTKMKKNQTVVVQHDAAVGKPEANSATTLRIPRTLSEVYAVMLEGLAKVRAEKGCDTAVIMADKCARAGVLLEKCFREHAEHLGEKAYIPWVDGKKLLNPPTE